MDDGRGDFAGENDRADKDSGDEEPDDGQPDRDAAVALHRREHPKEEARRTRDLDEFADVRRF